MLFRIHPKRVPYHGGSVVFSADGKSLILAVEKQAKEGTDTAILFCDAETGKIGVRHSDKVDAAVRYHANERRRLIAAGTVGGDDDDDPSGSVQVFVSRPVRRRRRIRLWHRQSARTGGGC